MGWERSWNGGSEVDKVCFELGSRVMSQGLQVGSRIQGRQEDRSSQFLQEEPALLELGLCVIDYESNPRIASAICMV